MAASLLERIWFNCRHQFSWPRRSDGGDYYQVCLQCGVKYRYDWSAMRRTDRLDRSADVDVTKKPPRKAHTRTGTTRRAKATWHPRERRLRIDVPVLYRPKNGLEWLHGRAENVSRSGLLFQADKSLPLGAAVELIVEMPNEIAGVTGAQVFCQATVARMVPALDGRPFQIAALISEYEFLPKGKAAGL
jgi:hypothetical protein